MFALHETTQRRFCRTAFLTLCVVPTLLTLAAVAYCNRPWRQRDWQQALASRLHVRARVADIVRPRPGELRLSGVEISDLRTGRTLGSVDSLTYASSEHGLHLLADRLELQSDQLPELAETIATWMTSQPTDAFEFRAGELAIVAAELQSLALTDAKCTMQTSGDEISLIVAAQTSDRQIAKASLRCTGEQVDLIIDAREVALPAWLVAQLAPGIAENSGANFTGVAAVSRQAGKLRGRLQGVLEDFDLSQHPDNQRLGLAGLAKFELNHFEWTDGTIDRVQGRLNLDQAAANFSFLTALQHLLACPVGAAWQSLAATSAEASIPITALACRFRIDSAGLQLESIEPGHRIVEGVSGPLLHAPAPGTVIPIAQLVRLFHQPRLGWLPDTRAAHDMANRLPLPGDEAAPEQR